MLVIYVRPARISGVWDPKGEHMTKVVGVKGGSLETLIPWFDPFQDCPPLYMQVEMQKWCILRLERWEGKAQE